MKCLHRALIQIQPELIAQRIAQDMKPTVTQIEWSDLSYTPVAYGMLIDSNFLKNKHETKVFII